MGTAGQGAVPTEADDDGCCELQGKDADRWNGTDACVRVWPWGFVSLQPDEPGWGYDGHCPAGPPVLSSPQGVWVGLALGLARRGAAMCAWRP